MTETLLARSETHDRITEAYLGRMGKNFMHATRKRIHWMCAEVRGRRVLDIGCSQGITAILLARDGFEVTGVDIDPQAIAEARDWLAAEPEAVRGRVNFVEGDASTLPVEALYDTVILGEILEHLDDPAALIAAAVGHLAPGGRLVVTVPFGIHDYPDHRQTFYLAAPHRLLAAHVALDKSEIIDRWIGFAGNRPEDGTAPAPAPVDEAGLDLLEAGFQALERRLRTANRKLRIRGRAAETRVAELETEVEARTDRLLAQADEIAASRETAAALEAELAAAHDRHAATESKRAAFSRAAAQLKQQNKALQRRITSLERSASFRLGHAVVRGVKAPLRLVRKTQKPAKPATGTKSPQRSPSVPAPADELPAIYARDGLAGLIAHLDAGSAAGASRLIGAAKTLRDAGHPEAERALLDEAVRRDPSEASYRALYWVAHRSGDIHAAWRCIREIAELYGPNPGPAQAETLRKLRRSPANQLAMLEGIPAQAAEAPARVLAPVPGRLCYVLHNSLPYSSGGYATRAHGLARGLTTAGLEVVCLTRPGYPHDANAELDPATTAVEDELDGIRYQRLASPTRSQRMTVDYVALAAEALTQEFKRLQPEWVMAASNYITALPALTAARRLGIPFFYEVRGFWEITRLSREPGYTENPNYAMHTLLEGEVARRADHVFTLTGPMRDELAARGVPEAQITILPNACDPDRFTPRPRDAGLAARLGIPEGVPVIGYIGTFVQYEGLEDLARACARLRARGRTFRLMLVGNENTSGLDRGPIMAEIERIAAAAGLTDWLIMPGRVPHDEVEAYYSLIDVAPFPRKPQPVTEMVSPMKPLEALAMEKAVVVSSVAALAGMITDGETGLVFEKGSIDSLTDTLDRLIGDAELRAQLAGRGREWVTRTRTWDETARLAFARISGAASPTREPAAAE